MPPRFVMEMQQVSKSYGQKTVLRDISLSFFYGAKIGVVGPNGAGKSTLLKIMAGLDSDIDGEIGWAKGMSVRYVAQEPQLDLDKTVRENLLTAMGPTQKLLDRYNEIGDLLAADIDADQMEKLIEEMGRLQEQIDAADAWELDRQIDIASDAMVLPPDDMPVSVLSGGERRRVALCMALLEKPDLLLLDEPTNHLDAETVAWLEGQLRDYPGTVIIVTHDRYFLDHITRWILELEDGRGLPFEGNYSQWLEQKITLLRHIEKKETARQRSLMSELAWIRSTQSDRLAESRKHISKYDVLAGASFQPEKSDFYIQIAPGPALGDKVLSLDGVTKCYNGVELLKAVSFDLPRGAIVGLVGPNGSGKTTLFRLIAGQETPDAGQIDIGESVSLSYVDQHRDALDATRTIFEEITDGADRVQLGPVSMNSRAYVARFNFTGTQQQKTVGDLSGGERNRVHLAKLLRRGGNLLLLDEPTNDLDVATMRSLEHAICQFPGSVMVISHDRFFLDRVCTHLLILEGQGRVRWFEGNFQAYEEHLAATGSDRLAHRRGKYRRLSLR
ncbi:MAG: energy-dependent translational throttle protein EttA [Phycisphaerae bacterium]